MNKEISIGDLAHEIMRIMEINCTISTDKHRNRPEKSEVDRLVCNSTKLTRNSNWKARYNLQQGLKETIQWFRENWDAINRDAEFPPGMSSAVKNYVLKQEQSQA